MCDNLKVLLTNCLKPDRMQTGGANRVAQKVSLCTE